MSISPWRATAIQMPSALATQAKTRDEAHAIIKRNVDKAIAMIGEACASEDPPRLVVLPEFALQGPPHGLTVAAWLELAVSTVPGWISAPLQEAAKKYGIYIGANQFEFDANWPGRYFNSCFLIDSKGEVILRFRRINTASWPSPHDFMDDYVARCGWEGTFPVADTELGRIAMLACGEIEFPEVSRCLMMHGAEIILHPTNEDNSPSEEAAKVCRAAENMAYLISANVSGSIGFSADGAILGGRSRIVDYRGKTIAYHEAPDETWKTSALIDVEALREARRDTSIKNKLLRSRWEMYRPFYATAKAYPANAFLKKPMADVSETSVPAQAGMENLYQSRIALRQ